jgi:hypothetical protein
MARQVAELQKLKVWKAPSLPVEGQGAGTARFAAQRPDECVGE